MTTEDLSQQSYSDLETQLQEAIAALEKPDLPLEDSLAIYEKAIHVLRAAQQRLEAAEQQVKILEAAVVDDDDEASADD